MKINIRRIVCLNARGLLLICLCVALGIPLFARGTNEENFENQPSGGDMQLEGNYNIATLGGGCFWCVEAAYEAINGITHVISGYSGGHVKNPNYKQVVSGNTNHAEVVQLYFDPQQITYEQILQFFFKVHDPTTLNRQGYDVGTQYRSIIFTHSKEQDEIARNVIAEVQEKWQDKIVTELKTFEAFYEAEEYHQDFYANNPSYGYCASVIRPKLDKLGLEGVEKIDVLDLKL